MPACVVRTASPMPDAVSEAGWMESTPSDRHRSATAANPLRWAAYPHALLVRIPFPTALGALPGARIRTPAGSSLQPGLAALFLAASAVCWGCYDLSAPNPIGAPHRVAHQGPGLVRAARDATIHEPVTARIQSLCRKLLAPISAPQNQSQTRPPEHRRPTSQTLYDRDVPGRCHDPSRC